MKFKFVVFIFTISCLLVACGGGSGGETPSVTEPTVSIEPTETPISVAESTDESEDSDTMNSPLVSPLEAAQVSPLSAPVPAPAPTAVPIVQFRLDGPVYADMEELSGFGPANLPIIIVDISGGEKEILAHDVTDEDGNFTTELYRPLKAGFRIGLTIGDLSDHELAHEDFQDRGFYGLDAMVFPQFGFFFDTKMTLEEK